MTGAGVWGSYPENYEKQALCAAFSDVSNEKHSSKKDQILLGGDAEIVEECSW